MIVALIVLILFAVLFPGFLRWMLSLIALLFVGAVLFGAAHAASSQKYELNFVLHPEQYGNPDPITFAYISCIGHAYVAGIPVAEVCEKERQAFGLACVNLSPKVPEVCTLSDDYLLAAINLRGLPGNPYVYGR